jgi:predicted RNA-binding Zn ribbon-like protein
VAYKDLKPAPGDLLLVQRFVNTVNYLYGGDRFEDAESAAGWLVEHGFVEGGERLKERDLRRLVAFREGLRELLLARNDEAAADVGELNEQVASAALRARFRADGRPALEAIGGEGAERTIARLLAIVFEAEAEGTWGRLKACRNEDCRWAFYDASKNRSGSWCTMDVCGARHKMRTYRRRRLRQQ